MPPTSSRKQSKICPYCGILLDASDTSCYRCGTELPSRPRTGFRPWIEKNFHLQGQVTRGILLFTVFIFTITWILTLLNGKSGFLMDVSLPILNEFGAKNASLIVLNGEVWRLVTAIFLHANFLHIFFNMWALIQIGSLAEELYGWQRYFFFYIASGVVGYAASTFFYPGVISIGASGAIMGLIGVLLAYSARNWRSHGKILGKNLLFWVAIILGYGILLPHVVDNAAHIGGLLSGFIMALPFPPKPAQNAAQKGMEEVLGWGTMAAVVLSFLFMGFSR